MTEAVLRFIEQLTKLAVPDGEDDLLDQIHSLVETLAHEKDPSVIAPIFTFIERIDDQAHLGDPGPLVHYLESFDDLYHPALLESVLRQPTFTTLHMTNRLLNWEQLPLSTRTALSLALKRASVNDALRPDLRKNARGFLDHQAARGHVEPDLPAELVPTEKMYKTPCPNLDNLSWPMLEGLIGFSDSSPAFLDLCSALGDKPVRPGKLFCSASHHQVFYRAGLEIEYSFKTGIQVSCLIAQSGLGDDYQPYRGPLPDGVQFQMSEQDIIGLRGMPDTAGGGDFHPIRSLGKRPRWIEYAGPQFSTLFYFDLSDGKLARVTLKKNKNAT